ncbi:hypothetical protein [Jannaschia ovalis]|uniref:Uncharacterized protein n=1 Tax=Jannaschia ovalis TaxID=3038773 RepID=A0ABY8LAD8_9RHOB|nr:hypothetical protein [Jannaschia sp. GRR-S6-38]WGH78311.1 hypothetical protein P8627_14985 [Jannaschia sp. GRR-S6-38]
MTRLPLTLALVVLPTLAPAAGHVADDPAAVDAVAIVQCTETAEGAVACTVDAATMGERDPTFCLAIGEDGGALANSTGATDDGLILFQDVAAAQIAALRCRPV